jgi:hypothetical protein
MRTVLRACGKAQAVRRTVTTSGIGRTRIAGPICRVVLAHFLDYAITLEQSAHLGLAKPAVATRSADTADSPGGGPSRDRFGVDAE